MARTSLSDVSGLADPILSYNFDMMFPSFPGGGDARSMIVKCMTTVLPGMELEQVTSALHGVEVSHAGRQIFSKTFQATFYETRDGATRGSIRKWIEFARNNGKNAGNFKRDYAITVDLLVYDDIPNIINTIKVFGLFPKQIDDQSFDGSNSNVITSSVTFSYDYTVESVAG